MGCICISVADSSAFHIIEGRVPGIGAGRGVLTQGKNNPSASSQHTSMSSCNAKRDTSRFDTVHRKQGNSKLSRYHPSQRKACLLAVSVTAFYSYLKRVTVPLRRRVLRCLWEFVNKCPAARACPGIDGLSGLTGVLAYGRKH